MGVVAIGGPLPLERVIIMVISMIFVDFWILGGEV
jgi:hypothetical protein